MRITRETVQSLIDKSEIWIEQLEIAKENGETWLELQDEPKNEEIREQIKDAREALESALEELNDNGLAI